MFQFFAENWQNIALGISGIVAGASVIAKVTPWEWDNVFLDKVQSIIHALALTKKPTA